MPSKTSVSAFIDTVRQLIINGEMKTAFEQLLDALEHRAESERGDQLRDAVLARSAEYHRLEREEQAHRLTREEFNVECNKISAALSSMLDDLPDVLEPPPPPVLIPDRERLEKIIGYDNLLEISWLERGLAAARSVCRIVYKNGNPVGTGFLVSNNLLMTNNHVIASPDDAGKMRVEFNYQTDVSGQPLPVATYDFASKVFLTNKQFDYTLIELAPPADDTPPLSTWGMLRLNPNADPVEDEHVVIVQHPGGDYKKIALTANQVVQAWEHRFFYTTDTMPGSSGSPVFNQKWEVIALHHAGGDQQTNDQGDRRFVNEGVLMSWIKKDLGNRWPGG